MEVGSTLCQSQEAVGIVSHSTRENRPMGQSVECIEW